MGKSFTKEQDVIILSVGKEAQEEGTSLHIAFIKIADELDRKVSSVYGRYKRLTTSLKNGNTSALTDSEKVVLKLKALSREKERNAEKFDLYKEKFEALQKEHDILKRKHRKLQLEHQTLIDTVNKAIGEEVILGGTNIEVG
ncbi:hypothetical protein [Paenibacillus agilis]|uniref:Uncharacterized protein n=1 Tax=Paenibacillus agilis TaxID=3020863 RepID=A0A559IE70_9BACL|nr:hypothetical protein [Paenibacillus agilis]TVX85959.1 hypothetical protein FPZ44_23690 [Paenibacillus agilis]